MTPTPNKHWLPKDTHNTVKLFIEEAKAKENEREKIEIKKCWHAKSIDFKHSYHIILKMHKDSNSGEPVVNLIKVRHSKHQNELN